MKAARWTQVAIADLRAAKAYLNGHDEALGRDLVERAVAAARFLVDYPALGSPVRDRWREWRVPRTRYLLIYRPVRTGVEIGRVRYDRSNWTLVPS